MSTSPENVKSAIQNSPLLWGDVREKIHVCKAQTSKVMGYKSKTVRGKASERCTHQPRAFTTQRERKCSIQARASISSVFSWITSYHLTIYFFLYCLLIQIVEWNYWTWSESFITDAPSSQKKQQHQTIQIVLYPPHTSSSAVIIYFSWSFQFRRKLTYIESKMYRCQIGWWWSASCFGLQFLRT